MCVWVSEVWRLWWLSFCLWLVALCIACFQPPDTRALQNFYIKLMSLQIHCRSLRSLCWYKTLSKRNVWYIVTVWLSCVSKFCSCAAMAQAVSCRPHCRGHCSLLEHSVWQLLVHVQVILLGEIIPFIPSCLTTFFFIPFEHSCPSSLPIYVSVLSFPFPFLPSCTLCYTNTVSLMQDVTVCACVIAQWNCSHGVYPITMHNFPKAHVLHKCVLTVQIKVCPMLCVVSFCWIYWCWFAKCCGHIWPLLIFL
jgi:hypothetical protein